MGAARTWRTGKEILWTVFVPDGNSTRMIQRTHRRLLVCMVNRNGDIWNWSPRTAKASEFDIYDDFKKAMTSPIYRAPSPSQLEFDFSEVPIELREMRTADDRSERLSNPRPQNLPAVFRTLDSGTTTRHNVSFSSVAFVSGERAGAVRVRVTRLRPGVQKVPVLRTQRG